MKNRYNDLTDHSFPVETSGISGILKAMTRTLVKTARSMHLMEEQKDLDNALDTLSNIEPLIEASD